MSPAAPRLVLASASPARARLLAAAGFEFDVRPAPGDVELAALEAARGRGEAAGRTALAAARAKAEAVAAGLRGGFAVLGADTLVLAADGKTVLGKARSAAEAREMLARLAGTRHRVITGVALLAVPGGARRELVAESEVEMAPLTAAEVAACADSGRGLGAAGAYRVQEAGGDRYVRVAAGSFSNVVGLPMEAIIPELGAMGVRPARKGAEHGQT